MSILGLGDDDKKPSAKTPAKKDDKPSEDKPAAKSSQSDEAKEILAKMEAKKDAGDCPFC